MIHRIVAGFVAACLLGLQVFANPAFAANEMGYILLTADQAGRLPRNGGKLGMEVGRAEEITSGGLTFELLRVKGVNQGSPGAQAGFRTGDQIIAVDGRVFPTVAAFAAYIGSFEPSRQVSIDYMPSNSGPQGAQRTSVTLGGAPQSPQPSKQPESRVQPESKGLSTGAKVAIGVGAAALFGCYKYGCFSRKAARPAMQQP